MQLNWAHCWTLRRLIVNLSEFKRNHFWLQRVCELKLNLHATKLPPSTENCSAINFISLMKTTNTPGRKKSMWRAIQIQYNKSDWKSTCSRWLLLFLVSHAHERKLQLRTSLSLSPCLCSCLFFCQPFDETVYQSSDLLSDLISLIISNLFTLGHSDQQILCHVSDVY